MIITIGGEYGCGGKRIAEKVAEYLGYKLCNDELVEEAVKNSGIDMTEATYRYFDESRGEGSVKDLKRTSSVQKSQYLGLVDTLSMDVTPLERRMDEVQRKICCDFADEGNCILLGRCADYYLRDRADCIHVFVTDELERRIYRIRKFYPQLSEAEAMKLIRKTDQRRADYYAYFTGKKWGDPSNYDLLCRTTSLGIDGSAELIAAMVKIKEKFVEE